jgi:hypothetical protein
MSSSRKRAYKHKAYAEIDHLKQKLMMVEHHYKVMELMARKAAGMVDGHKACLVEVKGLLHSVSLCEINSMSSREEMGRLTRLAITKIEETLNS